MLHGSAKVEIEIFSRKGANCGCSALQGERFKVSLCSLVMSHLLLLYNCQMLRQPTTQQWSPQRPNFHAERHRSSTHFFSLRIYRLECLPYSILRIQVHPTTCSIMPRNFHRKDRRHHKLLSNESATQPLSWWNQTQGHNQQNWWTADPNETFPRLGQHIVSNPNKNSFLQKQSGGSTRSFPSYQRDRMLVNDGPSNHQQKNPKIGGFQPNPRAIMLSSIEIKEYLLQAVEEGKRRVEEWIISEFEQASAPKRDIIIRNACKMDWQPEKTVVIPQAVDIRYPWDSVEDTGKERWRRKKVGGMG